MNQSELQALLAAHDVGKIVFRRSSPGSGWEVWVHDWPDSGRYTCASFGNCLEVMRTNEKKTYTSLDRAYAAMRALGYAGVLEIE
jgi:hypothetical protein